MARPDTFGGCVVTSTGSRLLAALLVFPLVSCGSSDGSVTTASPARYALNELGSFGWGSLADSSRRLTDQELRYGGAVLSAIVGFDVDQKERVLVLDPDYEKIAPSHRWVITNASWPQGTGRVPASSSGQDICRSLGTGILPSPTAGPAE